MRGVCKSCQHILPLKNGLCFTCRRESADPWLAAAIVLVIIGMLLAWFGVDWLVESSIRLTIMNW